MLDNVTRVTSKGGASNAENAIWSSDSLHTHPSRLGKIAKFYIEICDINIKILKGRFYIVS